MYGLNYFQRNKSLEYAKNPKINSNKASSQQVHLSKRFNDEYHYILLTEVVESVFVLVVFYFLWLGGVGKDGDLWYSGGDLSGLEVDVIDGETEYHVLGHDLFVENSHRR